MADAVEGSSSQNDYFYSESNSESGQLWDSDNSVSDDGSEDSTSSDELQVPSKKRTVRKKIETPEKTQKARWKKRHSKYAELQKVRRNFGSFYKSKKGENVTARELGLPCRCKKQCRELLQGTEDNIFHDFWNIGDYSKQNSYLFHNMKLSPKQRTYKKKTKNEVSRHKYTVGYFVKVNGTDVQICKKEFLAVHGLQKSKKRVDLLQQQISVGFATPKSDGRGKHSNHINKVPEEGYRLAKEHIESIPSYTSHYSRKKNPGKSYIDHDLNITSLYFEYYIPWCEERGIQPVSKDKYRRIFCTDFNIGFKLPKSDTCKTCDSLKIKIYDTKDSNLQKKLKVELELHQRRAEAMRDSLKNEIVRAKTEGNIAIISVDLQQALPVPNVTTGPAFYLRKLWVYNLGIHDCVTDQAYMYMWSEDLAKRGSDEICSIIYKYIE